ncbi:MAG: response regulator [Wenzhouxiangellaceae bacterium]|nr:response regulator [Wenzhouxiangellaceae bacterium]
MTIRESKNAVLVVDDQPDVREAMSLLLAGEGYRVLLAADPDEALRMLRDESVALVLFDMNYSRDTTSGREGLALLERMLEREPGVPMVAMTARGSVELAVEAMQMGAVDVLKKPW